MKKRVLMGFLISFGFFVTGCQLGSAPNKGTNTKDDKSTAYLVDSEIGGVYYDDNISSGVTTKDGVIRYTKSKNSLSFSVGKVKLGSILIKDINPDSYIFPADIYDVDRNDTNNSKVVKYIQLLQSLDNDQNPYNGIYIDQNTINILSNGNAINLETISTDELKNIVLSVGKNLIKREYAIAHYEETLRDKLKIEIDTVPPAPAIYATQPLPTNKDKAKITINGEKGAKVYVDGNFSNIIIDENNTATITIDTSGAEGFKSAIIKLEDSSNLFSADFNATIYKDLTPPTQVRAVELPSITKENLTKVTFNGEDNATVFINNQKVGSIKNGKLVADINTSGSDGNLTFNVTIMDLAGNLNATPYTFTIIKDTTPPALAQLESNVTSTNKDAISVEIKAEAGSKIYLNDDFIATVPQDGKKTISLDTSGKDEDKNFSIVLEDLAGNKSEPFTFKVTKDTVPPATAQVTSGSNIVNDAVTTTILGEKGSKVYINDIFVGRIDNSGKFVTNIQDPKNSYYESFKIFLEDEAGNQSPTYILRITFHREVFDSNTTYYVPKNATVLRKSSTNEEALIFSYNEEQNISGAVVKVDFNGKSISEKLNNIITAISNISDVNIPVKVTEQTLSSSILAEYTISTNTDIGSVDLISKISNAIKGGILSNLPTSSDKAIKSNYFNITLNLVKNDTGTSYITLAIVPNAQALNYQTTISSISNSTNLVQDGISLPNTDEEYDSNQTVARNADFLFVIDDSSSMRDYQNAVSQASNDFANAIENAGISYRIAIITTGDYINDKTGISDAYASKVLNSEGIIENNVTLFKQKVMVGINGSTIETGIYNAETALRSKALGDSFDGILTSMGMPKNSETPLSIIILSDEKSQYSSRAYKNFDVNNNLFIDRGYVVYSIIKPSLDSISQYDDLAKNTNGLTADITSTSNYNTIMNTIAEKSVAKLGYKLKYNNIIESTIYVTKNGVEVPHSNTNGWRYNETYNSILFSGTSIPSKSDIVKVTYSYRVR